MSNPKTFSDFGLELRETDCVTCRDLSCHNNVPSIFNGREYNVHISTDEKRSRFYIECAENSSVSGSGDISAEFVNEEDAVKFVCTNFNWFRCA